MTFSESKIQRDQEAVEVKLQKFLRYYERFLNVNLDKILHRVKTGKIQAREAINILNNLNESLLTAGMDVEIDKLTSIYTDEFDIIKAEFERLDPAIKLDDFYSDADIDTATALIDFDKDIVRSNTFMHTDELRSSVLSAIISDDVEAVAEAQAFATDRTIHHIETEIRTGVSGFNQTITNQKAKEAGLELFLYLGPDDKVTRPFCAGVIRGGRVYSKSEIDNMDNGHGLPVAAYGGGYNCRHQWRPIDKGTAEKDYGYKS